MQFSPSTTSADPSLAAALFPVAGPALPAAAAGAAAPAADAFEILFSGLTPEVAAVSPGEAILDFSVDPAVTPAASGPAPLLATAPRAAADANGEPLAIAADAPPAPGNVPATRPAATKSKPAREVAGGEAPAIPEAELPEAAKATPSPDARAAAEAIASFLPVPPAADSLPRITAEPEEEAEDGEDEAGEEMAALGDEADAEHNETADTPVRIHSAPRDFSPIAAATPAPTVLASASEPAATPTQPTLRSPVATPEQENHGSRVEPEATPVALRAVEARPAPNPRPTDFVPQRDWDRPVAGLAANAARPEVLPRAATGAQELESEANRLPVATALPALSALTSGPAAPASGRPAPVAQAGTAFADPAEAAPGIQVRIAVETAPKFTPASAASVEAGATDSASRRESVPMASSDAESALAAAIAGQPAAAPAPRRSSVRGARQAAPAEGEGSGESRPAILAAPRAFRPVETDEANSGSGKKFLNPEGEQVAKRVPNVGTAVANRELAMYSRTLSSLPTHPASGYDGMAAGLAAAPEALAAELPEPASVQFVASPHRAVEAVMTAIDRAAGRDQTSVKLDFAIGQESLAVRVELHDGEVRATFRTESPELRAALAHEWQHAAAGGDRTLKLAPAVFTAPEGDPQSGQPGEGFARQQERDAWRDETQQQAQVRTLLSRLGGDAAPGADLSAAAPRPAASVHSSRLNLFA